MFRGSLHFILLYFVFLFLFFLVFPLVSFWEETGRVTKTEIETVGKKENGTGMHLDISPASLPPFPLGLFFSSSLVICSLVVFPHTPNFCSSLFFSSHRLYTYSQGFDECDGGNNQRGDVLWASWLWAGTRKEREVKDRRYPPVLDCMYIYSDSEEQLPTCLFSVKLLYKRLLFYNKFRSKQRTQVSPKIVPCTVKDKQGVPETKSGGTRAQGMGRGRLWAAEHATIRMHLIAIWCIFCMMTRT